MGYLTPTQRLAIRARARGDPFLGGLLAKAVGTVIPFGAKLVGAIGRKISGAGAKKVAIGGVLVAKKIAKSGLGRAVAGGAAFGLGGAAVGRMLGGGAAAGGRRRRMHVTNVRALSRAMRRVEGFAKLARRTISFTKTVRMKKSRGRRAA